MFVPPFNVGTVLGGAGAAVVEPRLPSSVAMEKGQKHVLKIKHIPTGYAIEMPAFLDSFSDAYTSEWSEHSAYGRMDSAATFAGTRRNISIAWNLPADSFEHAQENLFKINALINFLYPLYDVQNKEQDPVLNMDPVLRLSFGNLVRDAKTGRGLLGYVNGITFDPGIEEGMFYHKPNAKGAPIGSSTTAVRVGQGQRARSRNFKAGGNPQNNQYYPKTVRLNIEFRVLHEHPLGFSISATESDQGRSRASYTFNEPSLNFANHPYMTNAVTEQASRGSWTGEVLQSQPRGSRLVRDPGSPEAVVANSAINPGLVSEAEAQPKLRETGAREGAEREIGYVRDSRGNILGGERVR